MGKGLLSPVPTWSLRITAEARGGLGHPAEQRARPRMWPTFTIAVARVLVMGTAGVVKAIVEGQSRDTGQGEQQDQEQQTHGVTHDGSTRVSWARLGPRQTGKRRKTSQLEEPNWGVWRRLGSHSLCKGDHKTHPGMFFSNMIYFPPIVIEF